MNREPPPQLATRATRSRLLALGVACSSVVAPFAIASCSGVPDVVFGDEAGPETAPLVDSARDTSTSDAEAGPKEAGPDVVVIANCPSQPPAGGVCCGTRPCDGCAAADCTACNSAACGTGELCCKRGANIQCRTADKCN